MNLFHVFFAAIILLTTSCAKDDPGEDLQVPVARLSIDDLAIDEGRSNSSIYISLRLSAPASQPVTVYLKAVSGTATAGEDFQELTNALVVFEPGDLQESYKVNIIGDDEFEGDETFTIEVESIENAEIEDGSATITLLGDDIDTSLFIPENGFESAESYPGMELIWQDEFDGDDINSSFWTFETGGGGWGNNESQYYRKENSSIVDGNLVIEARKEPYGGRSYTSSRMITKDKFFFQYGRVDIRAALPYGKGIWPALWMMGQNISSVGWPACGEIDVMELVGHQPGTTHGTAHWSNAENQHAQYGGSKSLSSGRFYDEFHVFSIIWDRSKITWLLDDVQFHTMNINPAELSEFRQEFFLLFNVAVGGNWPGYPNASTVFPQRMIVDYVRVFQDED